MLIVTERLRIRPVMLSDAKETAKLVTPAIARNLISWRAPMSVKEARQRIRESRKEGRERISLNLAILLKESDSLLGWIGFFMSDTHPEFELGFWLGERYQAQGLMTETLLATLPAAMRHLCINSIMAESFEDNIASIRLFEHIGMHRCGRGEITSSARGKTRTVKYRFVEK